MATPMPATAQMDEAVVMPRTPAPSRKMIPAPMKPMPVTMLATTRSPPSTSFEAVKRAAPVATSAMVRRPATY